MTTAKIAEKYGVALPETCRELNWQGETHFYWFICDNTQKALLHIIKENRDGEKYYHSINGGFAHNKFKIYPAPQMHEIAPFIPKNFTHKKKNSFIVEGYNPKFYFDYLAIQGSHFLTFRERLDLVGAKSDISVPIINHHYAQAYAEMYLKIKTLNLL